MRAPAFCLAAALCTALHAGCQRGTAPPIVPPAARLVQAESPAMGTHVQLMAYIDDTQRADAAFKAAFAELRRIEELMTTWEHPGWPQSDIMRLNQAAGKGPVLLSRDTMAVLQAAQDVSERSAGVFDVTFAAMGNLWHFDEDLTAQVPPAEAIAARLARIDYRALKLDVAAGQAALGRLGMQVNLGGIAKGYGVDACAKVLHAHGVHNFLVQAGGDLLVSGKKGDAPWKVGIRDPRGASPEAFFATAPLVDHAFSTAGDYERAFVLGGRRYHHILDPRTGYPATASRSVTVFAPSALLADALDDTIFILGPQAGLELLQHYPGCGAVIVDAANKVWISDTLRDVVTILHPPSEGV